MQYCKILTNNVVAKMQPKFPRARRSPRIMIAPKSYLIITKEGIDFVREKYSCSSVLRREEIKLYEFLMRLLSFGGNLPLTSTKKWRKSEILKSALENRYVTITAFRRELPKERIQKVVKEIWGKIPNGIYV